MFAQLFILFEVLISGSVLWLGLYIITRDIPWRHETQSAWQRPAQLVGFGLIIASIYLYGSVMMTISSSPQEYARWQQLAQWGIPISIVCFFWSVVMLTSRVGKTPKWLKWLLPIAAAIALLLAIGIVSGFILDKEAIEPIGTILLPYRLPWRQPFGYLYTSFILIGALGSILVLARRLPSVEENPKDREKVLIAIGGGLFLLVGFGAMFLFAELGNPYLPKQIGEYTAAAGAILVGYDIARYNALNHEQIIQSDFLHSFISVTTTVLVCILAYLSLSALFSYHVQALAVALISIFIVLTHTPYSWDGIILDRLFLPRWVVGYRDKLLLMRQQPLTVTETQDPLALAEATFDAVLLVTRTQELEELIQSEVENIFKYSNFNSDEVMSESSLYELQISQLALAEYASSLGTEPEELSIHHRADCLRDFLRSAIDEWSWSPDGTSRLARIERIILRKKYVEQNSRVNVEQQLSDQFDQIITGGGYSRRLKAARQRLTRTLHERELAYNHNS